LASLPGLFVGSSTPEAPNLRGIFESSFMSLCTSPSFIVRTTNLLLRAHHGVGYAEAGFSYEKNPLEDQAYKFVDKHYWEIDGWDLSHDP
jgi:hypothetical protein